jgi:hypothetical protein
MTTPPRPPENSGNPARKSPPPVPTPPLAPSRPQQPSNSPKEPIQNYASQPGIEKKVGLTEKTSAIINKIKSFLPNFNYELSTEVNKPNVTLNTIAQTLKKQFPTCKMSITEGSRLDIKSIDKGLRLGFIDKVTSFWGSLRTVDAQFSVQHVGSKSRIIANIQQKPTNFYAIFAVAAIALAIPTFFFLIGVLIATITMSYLANFRIKRNMTRILEEVSFGAEVT